MSFVQKYPYTITLISFICFVISFWYAIHNAFYCFNGANMLGIVGTAISLAVILHAKAIIQERAEQ